MPAATALAAFSLQQVLDVAGRWTVDAVNRHFVDHGQALPKALARANDRSWQSLSVALAGDGCVNQVKAFFASGDTKGIAQQVRGFLASNADCFSGSAPDFRKKCLAELKNAKKCGLLAADPTNI